MNCKDAQNLINGYVDGELDLVRNLEIEHHLQECALCSQGYKNHQVLRNGIKTGPFYFKAPVDLQRRIQLSLRKAAKAEAGPRVLPKWWLTIAAPMAAAAIVVLALVPFLRGPSADDLLAGEVPAYGETLVRRQTELLTPGGRLGQAGISLNWWPSGLCGQ